jgi:hypothetical protein
LNGGLVLLLLLNGVARDVGVLNLKVIAVKGLSLFLLLIATKGLSLFLLLLLNLSSIIKNSH